MSKSKKAESVVNDGDACRNCRFYLRSDDASGMCRCHVPITVNGTNVAKHPMVLASMWCGEWDACV